MKNAFLFFMAALLMINLNAQQEIADSLIELAKTKSGIEKADLLNELAEMLLDSDPDLSIKYAGEALAIWEENDDVTNAFYSFLFTSNAYAKKGDHQRALEILVDAGEKYENKLDPKYAAQLNLHLGMVYKTMNLYEKALQHLLNALKKLSSASTNDNQTGIKMLEMNIQKSIGDLFNSLENYSKALDHYDRALELSIERNDSLNMAFIYNSMGIAYEQQKDFDTAIKNYMSAMQILAKLGYNDAIGSIKVNISLLYFFKGEYNDALKVAKEALEILEISPDRYAFAINLNTIGRIYLKMNEPDKAYSYIERSYQLAKANVYTDLITDSYDFLGEYYALKGNFEKAYTLNRQYVQSKDSIYNLELSSRIHELQTRYETEKKEQEIELLTKDTEIKDLKLRRQEALLISLIGVFVLIVIVGVLWLSSNRQKQRLVKSELEKKNLETEQKLLRAQINPHFMFNALNSVQSYISANDNLKAMTYLAKFSQLMRNILEISRKTTITIEDEVETLNLYMELEAMRFKNAFNFNVSIDGSIITSGTYVPPMLVQPFVENSIKHGFREKEGRGKLDINFKRYNNMVTCTVEDNGIGRKKAGELQNNKPQKHKSLGMQVTLERLESIKKDKRVNAKFEVQDLVSKDGSAQGTRVIIEMPCEIE